MRTSKKPEKSSKMLAIVDSATGVTCRHHLCDEEEAAGRRRDSGLKTHI